MTVFITVGTKLTQLQVNTVTNFMLKKTGAFKKLLSFVIDLENLEQCAFYLRNVMPLFFVWNVLSSHVSQKVNDSELSDYSNWSQQASHLWMWIG